MSRGTVLLTGGTGFIGSHTCVELLECGYDVVLVDSLVNSSMRVMERITELTARRPAFHSIDLRDEEALDSMFRRHDFDAVVHLAGYKAVGESVEIPLEYYDNNIGGTVTLIRVMRRHNVCRLVFSSSCSIYGKAECMPLDENAAADPTNPYSRTKWMIEQILSDVCTAEPDWSVTSLRYFNPVGAHESGLLGEVPRGVPNNLMPYVMQVVVGRLPHVNVFGDDYDTVDGTGVRDYIHVVDVAVGHRQALERIHHGSGHTVYNLGTGVGTSVLELIGAAEKACEASIPFEVVGRRSGDVDALVADVTKAQRDLGWDPRRDIDDMCRDSWRFQRRNACGYEE